jgi:hypothetical protein
MKINREIFFRGYKMLFGFLNQETVDDLNFFLDKLDNSTKISGEDWKIVKGKYSYVLATVFWETSQTFDPISEMGSRRYLMSKPYYPYYGRGYVQLTWKANYIKFGEFLGIDLVNEPWLANEPENAWLILEEGMTRNFDVKRTEDPNFTAYTLDDCFNENCFDFVKARRIINGTDKAQTIAGIAEKFFSIIELTDQCKHYLNFAGLLPLS